MNHRLGNYIANKFRQSPAPKPKAEAVNKLHAYHLRTKLVKIIHYLSTAELDEIRTTVTAHPRKYKDIEKRNHKLEQLKEKIEYKAQYLIGAEWLQEIYDIAQTDKIKGMIMILNWRKMLMRKKKQL